MEVRFIDAHTHLNFAAFRDDWREVTERALKGGVGMINVGTQKDTSKRAVEIAENYDGVWAAVGLHPVHTAPSYHDADELGGEGSFQSRGEAFDYDYYKELASRPKVVAVGECGFDYYRGAAEVMRERQIAAFNRQIELSFELKKPLMIHCRQAFYDLIQALDSKSGLLNSPPGIIHFFSGTKEDAAKLLELGFYFTFGGVRVSG